MALQTFTSGQTLTASAMMALQANTYNWTTSAKVASYTLVAADAGTTITMTNASATTITVNTSLFSAGDTVRIINLGGGSTTITAGTATVNSAGSLIVPQYGSGTLWFSSTSAAIWIPDDRNSGLVYVTGTSFSAVASVSLPTNTFTSTYRNYRIIWELTSGSTDIVLTGRLRASGADLTGANYNTGYYQWSSGGAAVTFSDVNQTSAKLVMGISSAGVNQSGLIMDIISPQLTDVTIWSSSAFYQPSSVGSIGWSVGGGLYNVATAADSFSLIANTGNITGVYRVYGYSES